MKTENNFADIKSTDLVHISNNVAIEPLISQWYAWAHLLSPATAALNIKNRHLTIMDSYIKYPKSHELAIKKPEMLGGPFIDYKGKRVDEIKALREKTLEECSVLLELCKNIQDLNDLLAQEADGQTLSPLYSKMPKELRGLVELFYDLNHNPSFRFFEPLLYETEYYNDSLQSFNLLAINDDDSRSFVLSTPRLPDSNVLHKKYRFNDLRIDTLFDTWRNPIEYGTLKNMFEIEHHEEPLFKSFFSKSKPKEYKKYTGTGILTRYFGHACILIETNDISILVDPVISYGYESDISRYTFADLPDKIDFVCITHNHQDHILIETLLRIRYKVGQIIVARNNGGELQDPSLKIVFEKLGFTNVIEIAEMETIHFRSCSITGIPFLGEHADLNIRSKICPLITYKEKLKILFAADSCNHEPRLYERVQKILGYIDVIFLGMECDGAPLSWLYGPLLPNKIEKEKDQTRRLAGSNFDEAKALIDIFRPKNVFVYAMGLEPWLRYISSIKYTDESRPIKESNQILDYCDSKDIIGERLFGEKILEYLV
ncbi:MBL fold metallo-hydrolase [Croceitalea sp. MTPC5]|uniref:MBL fold metallo-hydrolase n=1 Tax=Croceitalea sp. MTPC5 TaxID=3056565 RepID=UPI002B3CDDF9|nr:MBL fold metallo-hydrolase [Croceitalea sp. MTPC5]